MSEIEERQIEQHGAGAEGADDVEQADEAKSGSVADLVVRHRISDAAPHDQLLKSRHVAAPRLNPTRSITLSFFSTQFWQTRLYAFSSRSSSPAPNAPPIARPTIPSFVPIPC